MTPSKLFVCALAACVAAGCSDAASEAPPAPAAELQPAAPETVDAPVAETAPPLAAAPLAPDAAALPEALPPAATARPRPKRSASAPTPETVSAEDHVPLESLLRAPQEAGSSPKPPLDLSKASDADEPLPVPPPFGGLERWKDRVHVERRSDPIGRPGPKQGTYSETEAGVRVPVDESVSLEGGVRVDSRSEPGAEEPERESIPRVGVEVKF